VAELVYLDASAIVKLVVEEPESQALREAIRSRTQRVSSGIALVEVTLAAERRTPAPPAARVRAILAGVTLIPPGYEVLESASRLGQLGLRALDAIHLATALSLNDDLIALVAYDRRLIDAARAQGLSAEEPG
jgi:predicted nucleic acid-binding protein